MNSRYAHNAGAAAREAGRLAQEAGLAAAAAAREAGAAAREAGRLAREAAAAAGSSPTIVGGVRQVTGDIVQGDLYQCGDVTIVDGSVVAGEDVTVVRTGRNTRVIGDGIEVNIAGNADGITVFGRVVN